MREAMAKEWSTWETFRAAKPLTQAEFGQLREQPRAQIVDTRWVLTRKSTTKGQVMKARLVAIGCQELIEGMRTDSPTASHQAICLTLGFASQSGWGLCSLDATSAYLQAPSGDDRVLLLRFPAVNPPPGCVACQVVHAHSAIYSTRDAGRSFYKHFAKVAAEHNVKELKLERAMFVFRNPAGEPILVASVHVDDALMTCKKTSADGKLAEDIIAKLRKVLHMKREDNCFTFCGKKVVDNEKGIIVSQRDAAEASEPLSFVGAPDRLIADDE